MGRCAFGTRMLLSHHSVLRPRHFTLTLLGVPEDGAWPPLSLFPHLLQWEGRELWHVHSGRAAKSQAPETARSLGPGPVTPLLCASVPRVQTWAVVAPRSGPTGSKCWRFCYVVSRDAAWAIRNRNSVALGFWPRPFLRPALGTKASPRQVVGGLGR